MTISLVDRLRTQAGRWLWPAPRAPQACEVQWVERAADQRNELSTLPDRALAERTAELRRAWAGGRSLDDCQVLVPGLALMGEALRRACGHAPYDVQYLAAVALARGAVAQMETGEGKTLATALAAYVRALAGGGVHVVTPNAYLAARDQAALEPAFRLAGLEAALLPEQGPAPAKRRAYAADVTYGTGYEFGFDYLRDQLLLIERERGRLGDRHRARCAGGQRPVEIVQTRRANALIDEVDSVLLDEAGLPLVVSSLPTDAGSAGELHQSARAVAAGLVPGVHFTVDAAGRRVMLTAQGRAAAQSQLPTARSSGLARPWIQYVEQALHAERLLRRDVDYVVEQRQVWLVDAHTGRIFPDRFLQGGLQQAVEVKEGLSASSERATAARMSRQRFFRLYPFLSGTTGTALGAERELWGLYRLRVATVPLRQPSRREIWPPRFFADAGSKLRAIACEVARLRPTGRPTLIGTRTIDSSRQLAALIQAEGIAVQLLNGRQDESEARVVARAGQAGTVTIATNMAGRGTDIRLGDAVAELGGLHVIAAERQASSRVDRQLCGRAARQGEPGSCQAFVAADDELLARHGPALAQRMRSLAGADGEIRADLTAQVDAVQRTAETAELAARQRLLVYDEWLDELLAELLREDLA